MKITNVYSESYRWPKEKPIQNGKHTFTHNELNLAIIETDEGITGYGSSYNVDYVEYLKPFLVGENPLCPQIFGKEKYFHQKHLRSGYCPVGYPQQSC